MKPRPSRVAVDVASIYPATVVGGGLYLLLTFRVTPGLDIAMTGLASPSLWAPVGLGAIVAQDGCQVLRKPGKVYREYDATFSLATHGRRRVMVDASLFLPRWLSAGRARVTMLYGRVEAPPLDIEVREPTDAEREVLDRVRGELRLSKHIGGWVQERSSPLDERPLAELEPVVLSALFRRWRGGPGKVSGSDLDLLPSTLEPEKLAFAAELAKVRGDEAEAERLRQQVRAMDVGLDWWMDELDDYRSWTGLRLK